METVASNKLVVGVDEVASMGQMVYGSSYILLPDVLLSDFQREVGAILENSKLSVFHGKAFVRRFETEYLAFLKVIKNCISLSPTSLAGIVLASNVGDLSWKREFTDFCNSLIDKVYPGIGISSPEVKAISKEFVASLFQFQELTDCYRFPNGCAVEFLIDSSTKRTALSEMLATMDVQSDLRHVFPQLIVPASHLLKFFYEAYRKRQFSNSPPVTEDGIKALWDEESYLIQAADVFGNFALSYVFKCLGKKSNTNDLKAKLFFEVFREQIQLFDFAPEFQIQGNDLVKKTEGLSKMVFSTLHSRCEEL